MPEQKVDHEIRAIEGVIGLLEPLDPEARARVIEYVFSRLEIVEKGPRAARLDVEAVEMLQRRAPGESKQAARSIRATDIRELREEKQPGSQVEMVVLVAYYLSELAPESEQRKEIGPSDITRYCKHAGYPLPKSPAQALGNAMRAGYLDSVGRGLYALNAVGHNLIVHRLPSGESSSAKAPRVRKTSTPNRKKRSSKKGSKPRS